MLAIMFAAVLGVAAFTDSPLSVPPSHGRSSSLSPRQPFAAHESATSSDARTATRGLSDWIIESGGAGM